jgi:hypothetical protein
MTRSPRAVAALLLPPVAALALAAACPAARAQGTGTPDKRWPVAPYTDGFAPNYAGALQTSLLFYEINRSGNPNANGDLRVAWRGPGHLLDRGHNGEDLTGGWFDAGDNVKWNDNMAYAAAVLAWGGADFRQGYADTGQMPWLKSNLKFVCDYFLKCFTRRNPADYELYIEVGEAADANLTAQGLSTRLNDHSTNVPPELYDWVVRLYGPSAAAGQTRPAYKANNAQPATDVAGMTAAALAATSVVFRQNASGAADSAYADTLLDAARRLYACANANRGAGTKVAKNGALLGYKMNTSPSASTRYHDELCWAALWLHRAETAAATAGYSGAYLTAAKTHWASVDANQDRLYWRLWGPGALAHGDALLLAALLPDSDPVKAEARKVAKDHLDFWYGGPDQNPLDRCWATPAGLSFQNPNGGFGAAPSDITFSLDYATNNAFLGFVAAKYAAEGRLGADDPYTRPNGQGGTQTVEAMRVRYRREAKRNVDYVLGNNPYNASYLIGFTPPGITSPATGAPLSPGFFNTPLWRSAAGPYAGFEHFLGGRPQFSHVARHVGYGGMMSGPGARDEWSNADSTDHEHHEVGTYIQAGLVGSLAALAELYAGNGSAAAQFPPAESPDGPEVFAEAAQSSFGNSATQYQVTVRLQNQSGWPARALDRLSARWYFTLDGSTTLGQVSVTPRAWSQIPASRITGPFADPTDPTGRRAYVNIDFGTDYGQPVGFFNNVDAFGAASSGAGQFNLPLFPGGVVPEKNSAGWTFWFREVTFIVGASGAGSSWDPSNDWSFRGLASQANQLASQVSVTRHEAVPVYDNGVRVWGREPDPAVATLTSPALGIAAANNGLGGYLAHLPVTVEVRAAGSVAPLESFTVTPDLAGRVVFRTARSGSLDIAIQPRGFLRRVVPNVGVPAGGAVTLPAFAGAFVPGDVDGDNRVTATDLSRVTRALGSIPGDRNWDPSADLNLDRKVDAADRDLVNANLRKNGDK